MQKAQRFYRRNYLATSCPDNSGKGAEYTEVFTQIFSALFLCESVFLWLLCVLKKAEMHSPVFARFPQFGE